MAQEIKVSSKRISIRTATRLWKTYSQQVKPLISNENYDAAARIMGGAFNEISEADHFGVQKYVPCGGNFLVTARSLCAALGAQDAPLVEQAKYAFEQNAKERNSR